MCTVQTSAVPPCGYQGGAALPMIAPRGVAGWRTRSTRRTVLDMSTSVADQWADREAVPAAEVARVAGIPRKDIYNAQERGLLKTSRAANGRTVLISRDDALMIVAAALIMVAAGVMFATAFRFLSETGAQVGAGGITIPLPAA